jgi:hypothetical protein
MNDNTRQLPPRIVRAAALFFAPLLVLTLVAFPALHSRHCSGVCSAPTFTELVGSAKSPSCHGGGGGHETAGPGPSSGGCQCLDDCCSLNALFNTPDAVSDGGPTAEFVAPMGVRPAEPRPDSGAWILPYPTGPPSIV